MGFLYRLIFLVLLTWSFCCSQFKGWVRLSFMIDFLERCEDYEFFRIRDALQHQLSDHFVFEW
jgi:hypothetical protein